MFTSLCEGPEGYNATWKLPTLCWEKGDSIHWGWNSQAKKAQ